MEDKKLNYLYGIAELIKRHTQGEILSETESAILSEYRNESGENEALFQRMLKPSTLAESILAIDQTDTSEQLRRFNRRVRHRNAIRRIYKFAPVAAFLLLTLSIGFYWLYDRVLTPTENAVLTSSYGGDALPATNRATLTLSSGATIQLREDQQGLITDEHGISYEDGNSIVNTSEVQYATLSTPRGGQYQITLSDGSKVSLNAGSSLEYPVQFAEGERRVMLKGEGYFEVNHNENTPFTVITENQSVTVLGTVFNVNAYSSKEATTLVSGKVSVTDRAAQIEKQLTPNMQAVVLNGKITTRMVDVADYTGWKSGRFQGERISLQEIVEDIERWYDVEFVYPSNFKNNERAFVSINRHEKLSGVLQVLELTYGVRFHIDGKEVYVR